jgi:hypothetical protein
MKKKNDEDCEYAEQSTGQDLPAKTNFLHFNSHGSSSAA